jgi:hypothetical protein
LSQEIKQKRALRIEWEEEDAKLAAEKTEPLGPISWTKRKNTSEGSGGITFSNPRWWG